MFEKGIFMKQIAPGVFVRANGKVSMTKSGRRRHIAAKRLNRDKVFAAIATASWQPGASADPRGDHFTARRWRDRILGTPHLRKAYGNPRQV